MGNKTVFDTNVWVSYFMKGDFPGLVLLVKSHGVEFVRCADLTKELIDVLNRKKIRKHLELPVDEYIQFYEKLCKQVNTRREFTGCRDPLRNYIAVLEKPFYLLNGNDIMTLERLVKDLKDLRAQFVEVIRKGGGE